MKVYLGLFVLLLFGCTEEFVPKTEVFESLLVIEGNITDELKQQEIRLSRTFRFEEDNGFVENNAEVKVFDDFQNEYFFEETESGRYISKIPFQALANRKYTLSVKTDDGKSYSSDPVVLPQKATIDNVYAERMTNDDGLEGIGIFVDSFDTTGNAQFYRYEYEETYRFFAPFWYPRDIVIIEENPLEVDFVERSLEKRVCYKTDLSEKIIITKTDDFEENKVLKFLVRFVGIDNYIISDRYTILVHQFIQSREAHEFYETLLEFSNSETLFSQIQPGFIAGNIKEIESTNQNVVGFFQVTSVSSKRVFFNYRDYFVVEDLPPYFETCSLVTPTIRTLPFPLISAVENGLVLAGLTGMNNDSVGPYFMVRKACGDCTEIGKTEIPDFWEN